MKSVCVHFQISTNVPLIHTAVTRMQSAQILMVPLSVCVKMASAEMGCFVLVSIKIISYHFSSFPSMDEPNFYYFDVYTFCVYIYVVV